MSSYEVDSAMMSHQLDGIYVYAVRKLSVCLSLLLALFVGQSILMCFPLKGERLPQYPMSLSLDSDVRHLRQSNVPGPAQSKSCS